MQELERWRVVVRGIDRVFKLTLETPGLAPEIVAVVDKADSCLDMVGRVLDGIADYVRSLPIAHITAIAASRDVLWQVVFNSVPFGLAIFSRDEQSVRVNAPGLRMMGFSDVSQALQYAKGARPPYRAFHVDGTPLSPEDYPVALFMRGGTFAGELRRFVNGAGEEMAVLVSGDRADPPDPDSPSILMGFDVTEIVELQVKTREAEYGLRTSLQALEQRTAELEALIESLDEAIFLLEKSDGPSWRLVTANQAALDMFGAPNVEELRSLHPAIAPENLTFVRTSGEPVPRDERPGILVRKGLPFSDYTTVVKGRDGQEVEVLISGGPVRQVPGMRQRYIETVRVVTELRRLERAREQLLAVVSHEMRNPLQVMKGLLDVMRLTPGPTHGDDQNKYMNMMSNQIDHLSAFMNDVLRAYRETTRPGLEKTPLDLCNVLRAATSPYAMHGDGHEVSLDVPAEGLLVEGDGRRLEELVLNLLSNAVKYSPTGTRVRVSAQRRGPDALVAVEDEGIGIPPDELEKVFEGFYRRRDLSSWHTNGVGLGLFISRSIARRHGGDLWAENRPEGGTMMCLRLPLLAH